ncbi:MAG: alpha-amylase/4-alpha-glucanotransferase domain-containing protein [Bacteroidota bacterium]
MKTINLVLGTHNHQPVGNFESVLSHACESSYQPFLDLLEQFPKVKFAQHYSGILLEWFQKNNPALMGQIRRMARNGQIEIMGGAFYEAILAVVPDHDKGEQLNRLSKFIRKEFGAPPTGMWTAERVWEQHMTKFIAEAGLRYVIVDDTHFRYAGVEEQELLGYYVTEEQGKTVCVFPVSKVLRYAIPFQPVHATIDYLRSIATEEGSRIAVFADDGEKFGVWPKTFDHVYKAGWLKDFFQALTENADWIRILHYHEAIDQIPPVGRIYLPNASYAEMMRWTLPVRLGALYEEFDVSLKTSGVLQRFEPLVKGGFWRSFFVKYPEANNMHKKMTRVSDRAAGLKRRGKKISGKTMSRILASQCNDAYWHGVFGGLYLPVLRYPVYHNLITAESDLDKVEKKTTSSVEACDFDCDGHSEILMETPNLNCYLKPDLGGFMFELDFKSISLNLLDIVSRRKETYHEKLALATVQGAREGVSSIHDVVLVKETGLEKLLVNDWYRHGSLIDHFFGARTRLDDVWRCQYDEEGDFVNQPYSPEIGRSRGEMTIALTRDGSIWRDGRSHHITVRKSVRVAADEHCIHVLYEILNREDDPIDLWFGVEFNVGLQAGNMPDRYYYVPDRILDEPQLQSRGEIADTSIVGLRDEWLGADVKIDVGTPTTFWRFPLETVSMSESGFERIFQSSVIIPQWKFRLDREWRCAITHGLDMMKTKGRQS